MSSSKCKSRTLSDIWEFYPHKKNPPFENSGTIPVPYVKQKDISDDPLAITYATYMAVMTDILDLVVLGLQEGKVWNIGNALGELCFTKKKCKSFVDRIKSKEEGKTVKRFKNPFENYMILPEWERLHFPIQNRWLWRFKVAAKVLRKIYQDGETDYTKIYKFRDK